MGDIITGTIKSQPAKTTAEAALAGFGRSEGKAEWRDVPSSKTGDWFYDTYKKVHDGSAITEYYAKELRDKLNDWSKNPSITDRVQAATVAFQELLEKMPNITALGANPAIKVQDAQEFRSAGFSAMMALSAGYESGLHGDEFKETFAKIGLAERLDREYERYGGPPKEFQIDRNEEAGPYWETKRPTEADPKVLAAMKKDLDTVDKSSSSTERTAALERLAKNFEKVTDPKLESRGLMSMVTAEALRKPLDCMRPDQPNEGRGGPVASKTLSSLEAKQLETLAIKNKERYERELEERAL